MNNKNFAEIIVKEREDYLINITLLEE